ncbi:MULTISPECIES: FkbM family methyltransferase [unclassified Nostoc]|uniref:FkbM family methyltransferase n=1 Tax=unclassified Nostoc TaxID=2593658 RepID=UPI000B951E49|nr:FkbM family methyltransferase [Nostoc sp. 'Peltigera membranacea cyanobiont' 232]OYE06129.1 methyltransferase [Nostoc sp. 'Peltigera membranacea cyanobiont' 232]
MNMEKMVLPNNLECYYLGKEETEYIFSEIFTEQQYFRYGITLNEGDCIFDVGANIGLFALFVSQFQKQVKIFAFEPIKPIFDVLQANTILHSLSNITLLNYGLSSENNSVKLFTFYPNMTGNSTTKPLEKLQQREVMNTVLNKDMVDYLFKSEEVRGEIRTLSSVINELDIKSIDLLKIDVEGEEYEVLKGINPNDWSKIKQIVAEVHDIEGRIDKIQVLLKSNGFNIKVEKNSLIPSTLNNFNLYAIRG